MSTTRALLFDLDGTLVDTIPFLVSCARHTFEGYDRMPSDAEWMAGIGTPLRTQIAAIARKSEDVEPLLQRYRRFFCEHHDQRTRAFEGAVETLRILSERGHRIAVVTSKGDEGTRRTLKHVGLVEFVSAVITADSCVRGKPDPMPVRLAAERLGMSPSRAVMIGDSPHDIAAGRAAGTTTVAVLSGIGTPEALAEARPDHQIPTVRDLPALLERI